MDEYDKPMSVRCTVSQLQSEADARQHALRVSDET